MLFKDRYPKQYEYFRAAVADDVDSRREDNVVALRRVLAQLETVHVFTKCACGERGCETFSFVDTSQVVHRDRIAVRSRGRVTLFVDVDAHRNLLGIEKTPD